MAPLARGFAVLALLAHAATAGAAGDPERGRAIAAACSACHGETGVSPSAAFPILAGQHAEYLVQALLAYQSGTRADSIMGGAVRTLDRQQLEDVAAFFASQPRGTAPASAPSSTPPATAPGGGMTARLSTITEAGALAGTRAPAPTGVELAACPSRGSPTKDTDGDGLADAFDAAPRDAGEFVRDADGDGWFAICNVAQLQAIQTLGTEPGSKATLAAATRNIRRYELVQDLDLAAIPNWTPIGNCGPENNCMVARDRYGFAGALDGNGHALRNLTIARPETGGVGLFGTLAKTGVVRNLVLEDATVTGLHGTGALVGANFGYVADCRASVQVTGRLATAGLVGGHAGQVSNCHVTGRVSGQAAVGGLAGDMNGAVRNSSADVRVTAGKGVGGLVGLNTTGRVQNSHARGTVSGTDNVGGLVGVNTDALVENSYATGAVEATGTNAGGLVGFNSKSRILSSYATGAVTGSQAAGGLVGRNNGAVRNAYATATAGLVGDNTDGSIDASGDDAGN